MRSFNTEFTDANTSLSREPRYVLSIENDTGTFHLVSHSDIITGGEQFVNLISTGASSQKLSPERGVSEIGGMSIKSLESELTEKIRTISNSDDSLIDNKSELFIGYAGLAFANYGKLATYWVDSVNNDYDSYVLGFKDTQRFAKQSVFEPKLTKFNGSIQRDQNITAIFVTSTDGFEVVEHTANWKFNPSETVGYFRIKGVDSLGFDNFEIFSYTGKTADSFTGVTRGAFRTRPIEVDTESNAEVEEYIYLELPVVDMAVTLLTGDLVGQIGQTIPEHWSAEITADKINLASFQDIDNINLNVDFRQPAQSDAKTFLFEQVLAPFNLSMRVDANGELELFTFGDISSTAGFSATLDNNNVKKFSGIKRDSKTMVNRFAILWQNQDKDYLRTSAYVDLDSIARNHRKSKIKVIRIQGIRNTSADAENAIQGIAQRISSRYSNQSLTATATVLISDAVELEVGDRVRCVLDYPDFNAVDTLDRTFEVQQTIVDFAKGSVALKLFANSLLPSEITETTSGEDVAVLDHTGWKGTLAVALTNAGISYTDSGGTLTIESSGTLTGGTTTSASERLFHLGNVTLDDGVIITTTLNFILDCGDLTFGAGSGFDSSENGYAGGSGGNFGDINGTTGIQGFFGLKDVAGRGTHLRQTKFGGPLRHGGRGGTARYASSIVAAVDNKLRSNYKPYVDLNGVLRDIPGNLIGSSGSGGAESNVDSGGAPNPDGGDGGRSGGGIILICDAFFSDPTSILKTDGGDPSRGDFWLDTVPVRAGYGGTGGVGFAGAIVVLVKKRSSSYPLLQGITSARSGTYPADTKATGTEGVEYDTSQIGGSARVQLDTIIPYTNFTDVNAVSNVDLYNNLALAAYISSDVPKTSTPQDRTEAPLAPVLTLKEAKNTPLSEHGDVSTITATALPQGGDNDFSYARFEYRALGQKVWTQMRYAISTEVSDRFDSDGTTWEFRATSFNKLGLAGGESVDQITVAFVTEDGSESDGGVDDPDVILTVPPVKRLKLVNQIDNGENWNKFKSGNAEFSWAKISVTRGGNLLSVNGELDLHFRGYKIRILTTEGAIIREETTLDSFYTYTREENKKDDTGRQFVFDVQVLASTGFATGISGIEVENPQPDSPANLSILAGFTGFLITFDLPDDIDFVGSDFYIREGVGGDVYSEIPKRIEGNSISTDGLKTGTTYQIGLKSVDEFGDGGQIDQFGIVTAKIASGDLDVIDTPLVLDEEGGRVITNNNGYLGIMGVTVLSDVANPIIFAAYDAILENTIFFVDVLGNGKFGKLDLGSDGSISSDQFAIDGVTGDASFSGELSAASGTFSGVLTASAINAVDTINMKAGSVYAFDTDQFDETSPITTTSTSYVNTDVVLVLALEAGWKLSLTFRANVNNNTSGRSVDTQIDIAGPASYSGFESRFTSSTANSTGNVMNIENFSVPTTGNYTVRIKFKATAGTATVRTRQLHAELYKR